jgi:hypothetical protein
MANTSKHFEIQEEAELQAWKIAAEEQAEYRRFAHIEFLALLEYLKQQQVIIKIFSQFFILPLELPLFQIFFN